MQSRTEALPFDAAVEVVRTSGRPFRLRVRGNSMHPQIRAWESVTVRPMEARALRPGDFMVFRDGEQLIVHSFVWRRGKQGEGRVCQKGKGFRRWQWVPDDNVVGRVESVQGRSGDRCITHGPRLWRSRISGLAWCLCILLFETFRSGVRDP